MCFSPGDHHNAEVFDGLVADMLTDGLRAAVLIGNGAAGEAIAKAAARSVAGVFADVKGARVGTLLVDTA